MSRAMGPDSEPKPENGLDRMTTVELKLLADREKARQDKAAQRRRRAEEHAQQVAQPHPSGYRVGPVPAGLSRLRKWYRRQHNAFSDRKLSQPELRECGFTFGKLVDSYKASAAIRSAEAAEATVRVLERLEHGQAATVLLEQLQRSLAEKRWRPQPPRALRPPAEGQA